MTDDNETYFEFGALEASDNEEEIQLKKEKEIEIEKQKLEKHRLEVQNYRPIGEEPGWFNLKANETMEMRFESSGLGATQIKYSLEQKYFNKRYEETIALGTEFLNKKHLTRVSNGKEVVEILIKAYLKLKQYDMAYKMVLGWKDANDLGHLILKGIVFSFNGLLNDAITCFKKYDQIRPNDYQLYQRLSECFINWKNINNNDNNKQKEGNNHIYLIYKLSYKIMKTSQWNIDVDFINQRYLKEVKKIEDKLKDYKNVYLPELEYFLKQGIITEENIEWLKELIEAGQKIDLIKIQQREVKPDIKLDEEEVNRNERSVLTL
ncbi:hypothetical protein K502DRAFT_342833 [Neoconidiobolus thromboides FSU 785]|nr:hypothetical protein K502DRAFT_342833 [Neoconidiobolus thromboides FSU 785]